MDLARTSLWALLYRMAGMACWMVVGVITARALTLDDRGSYSTAVAAIASLGGVGASFAASSGYFVSNQRRPAAEVASNTLILSFGLSAVLLALSLVIAAVTHGETRFLAILAGLAMLPEIARNGIAGVFLATGALGRYSIAVYGPAAAGAVTVGVWVVVLDHRTAGAALGSWVAGQYLALLLAASLGRHWWGWLRTHAPDIALMRRILVFGSMTGLVAFVALVNFRVGQLLVIGLDSRAAAGIYASATALSEGVWFFSQAVSTASYGRVGGLNRAEASALTARAVRHTVFFSLPAAAALFVAAPVLVTTIYGDRYGGAATSLRILAVGAAVFAPRSLIANYFTVQLGRPHLVLALTIVATTINIALGLLLIPRIGFVGAAWAATASYVVSMAMCVAIFLATSPARLRDLWWIEREDITSYLRLARQVLRGEFFGRRAGTEP